MCEVHVPSDESGDNEIESIDNPASLIALLERAKNTGRENLRVTINVHSDDSTCDDSDDSTYSDSDYSICDDSGDSTYSDSDYSICDDSDDSTYSDSDYSICDNSVDSSGRSWNDSLHLGLARNCSLNSLTLTINNFSPWSTELSPTLIRCLEGCSSLKSLTLTLNVYNYLERTYASHLREGLGRNTSLISLTLTLNIYTRVLPWDYLQLDDIPDNDFVPNFSLNSFTLTINDFSFAGDWILPLGVLWANYKSLTTFNLTFNNTTVKLRDSLDAAMKVNSLRTLRLKIDDCLFTGGYDFSKLVVKSSSLELIELTISRHGDVGSWLETLKWEKQR